MKYNTWCTHKFVIHGFLWYLHEDHHQPKYAKVFERNDIFFVIFAVPSIFLIYFGGKTNFDYRFFIGLGIFVYGLSYFLLHDVIVHQRFKIFKNTKNKYLLSLSKDHKVYQKYMGKEHGKCCGIPVVTYQYFYI